MPKRTNETEERPETETETKKLKVRDETKATEEPKESETANDKRCKKRKIRKKTTTTTTTTKTTKTTKTAQFKQDEDGESTAAAVPKRSKKGKTRTGRPRLPTCLLLLVAEYVPCLQYTHLLSQTCRALHARFLKLSCSIGFTHVSFLRSVELQLRRTCEFCKRKQVKGIKTNAYGGYEAFAHDACLRKEFINGWHITQIYGIPVPPPSLVAHEVRHGYNPNSYYCEWTATYYFVNDHACIVAPFVSLARYCTLQYGKTLAELRKLKAEKDERDREEKARERRERQSASKRRRLKKREMSEEEYSELG